MRKQLLIQTAVAMAMGFAISAHADDTTTTNTSTVKKTDVSKDPGAPVAGTDLDAEITNAKLRAESGSKNRFSMKANLNLNGGSLNAPLTQDRPKISAAGGTDVSSGLSGTVAGAYRLSTHDVLRFGTGIAIRTPFQDSVQTVTNNKPDTSLSGGKPGRTTDISNPYLDYGYNWRSGNVQNAFDMSYTQYTQDFYKNEVGWNSVLDVNHTFMWEFKSTKWSPGVNFDVNYSPSSHPNTADDHAHNPNGVYDLELAAYPLVEYAFTDNLSFRTVFRFLTYDHYRADSNLTYEHEIYTQSVGLGYAITRDIYTYPNFQFAPQDLSSKRTNVGISATINL